MSVCVSVRKKSDPTGQIFMKFNIWVFLKKLSKKIQVSLNSDKNNRYLQEDVCIFTIISRIIFLEMENVGEKICTQNLNTYFRFSNPLLNSNLLKDNEKTCGRARQATAGNEIRHMRFACWRNKATENMQYLLHIFHRKKGFGNAPQC
jgi:hypothetical protein